MLIRTVNPQIFRFWLINLSELNKTKAKRLRRICDISGCIVLHGIHVEWCVGWCVRSILWHVKQIEFHKEIWSLIRLLISTRGSGLNLSAIYDSSRHFLSLPTSPSTSSFSPHHPSSPHPNTHTHTHTSSPSSYLPNTFQLKNTPFLLLSVECITPPTSHVSRSMFIPVFNTVTPLLKLYCAVRQFVILTFFKTRHNFDSGHHRKRWCSAAAAVIINHNPQKTSLPGLVSNHADSLRWPHQEPEFPLSPSKSTNRCLSGFCRKEQQPGRFWFRKHFIL